jgi:glutamyl-tRNA reductase
MIRANLRGKKMASQENKSEVSEEMHSLLDSSKSTSEAFSIIATELIEVKAMLMALIDLQKSALFATGVSESELESNVQNLIDGYRNRYLNGLTNHVREAADQQ